MYCKYCGAQNKEGAIFCKSCGKNMVVKNEQSQNISSVKKATIIERIKKIPTGWKVVIGVAVLILIIVIVDGVNSGGDSAQTNNSGTTQSIVSSEPLPTVPSQFPNYNASTSAPLGDAPVASSSETGSPFSSGDVASYLTAVGEVNCNQNGQPYDSGSGSVWQFAGSSQTYVLTNYHVINGDDSCTFEIFSSDTDGTQGDYDLDISSPMRWNQETDIALVPMTGIDNSFTSSTPIADLNYSIAGLTLCPTQMPQEAPVAVLGFPASTQGSFSVLNGVISGYDQTNPDAYDDYYTTAPVDNGDSGGVALSKYNDNVCFLGIPTWVSHGESQNEGDILDINNIFYIDGSQSSQ